MTASMEKSPESLTFGSPFDDEDADLIIRSSDNVDFRVYRVILSKASPVFRTTLSLPQPVTRDTRASREPCPVIDLAEGSNTIAPLLTSIYPIVFATTSRGADDEDWSLDDLIAILAAAKKYEMASASERVLQSFADAAFLRDKPIEAFCAAHKYKLEAPARLAAKACLQVRLNLDIVGDKLTFLDGQALQHLWRYHRACSAAAVTFFDHGYDGTGLGFRETDDTEPWWEATTAMLALRQCPDRNSCTHHSLRMVFAGYECSLNVNSQWHDYLARARAALQDQPCADALLRDDVLRASLL
ncbi:hypothetical protein BC834DRAFT_353102 [Gloeopeniophorella convolvens]|nr:hypothetical protein BC834DRAFT_353102 [Gloeopeniophorella convolvens]